MDTDDNHRERAERSSGFSLEHYVQIDPNEINGTLATMLKHYAAEDVSILGFGCSPGRHLAYLHDHDYEDITGIDIGDDSSEVMTEYFLELVDTGTFLTGVIGGLLPDFPDNKFDVIYSVETFQHVHLDGMRVFEETARVSSDLVITAENEGNGPTRGRSGSKVSCVNDDSLLYHRNWKDKFSEFGLAQLPCEPGRRDMVRVFRAL